MIGELACNIIFIQILKILFFEKFHEIKIEFLDALNNFGPGCPYNVACLCPELVIVVT